MFLGPKSIPAPIFFCWYFLFPSQWLGWDALNEPRVGDKSVVWQYTQGLRFSCYLNWLPLREGKWTLWQVSIWTMASFCGGYFSYFPVWRIESRALCARQALYLWTISSAPVEEISLNLFLLSIKHKRVRFWTVLTLQLISFMHSCIPQVFVEFLPCATVDPHKEWNQRESATYPQGFSRVAREGQIAIGIYIKSLVLLRWASTWGPWERCCTAAATVGKKWLWVALR